jgi:hypothetical protein
MWFRKRVLRISMSYSSAFADSIAEEIWEKEVVEGVMSIICEENDQPVGAPQ